MKWSGRQIGFLFAIVFLLCFAVSHGYAQDISRGLIPPTEIAGYSPTLQKGDGDLTELVVLITNYVLGFLGMIALTAIIYAGILYVANFGNDDLTGKAKNIIMYVVIGILIILLSYAFVNFLVGVVNEGEGGSSTPKPPVERFVDPGGKTYIYPIATSLRQLGDLCLSTPIGLLVNNSGCAQGELVADTDSDRIANLLDTDDDNDLVVDDLDPDDDGDNICDGTQNPAPTGNSSQPYACAPGPDLCPDTLSFVTFKDLDIERGKVQANRVDDEAEYEKHIAANNGCAEYQRRSDLDGDGFLDFQDCDMDDDGLIEEKEVDGGFCWDQFFAQDADTQITADTVFKGVTVLKVIRDELDKDDDNDLVLNFGAGLEPDARDLLLRQLANNFQGLMGSLYRDCATLPQTTKVLEYCRFEPEGKLIRLLRNLSSDINLTDFDTFEKVYDEFGAIARNFPVVEPRIKNAPFEGVLPSDSSPFTVLFDARDTVDPYQEFCAPDPEQYYWFVNKNLDFSQGLSGILNSALNPPSATGITYTHEFTEPGIFNVQLLVRSACKYNTVHPGVGEDDGVEAAIAGLTSARVSVREPRARLVVKVADQPDGGNKPFRVVANPGDDILFDLTESRTSSPPFLTMTYNCGDGKNTLSPGSSDPESWTFNCRYTEVTQRKNIALKAQDSVGEISRNVTLEFADLISLLEVSPGLRGTTETDFTFDGSKSQSRASRRDMRFTFLFEKKTGTSYVEASPKREGQEKVENYRFTAPGEYRVSLEVSAGGATDVQIDRETIIIEEQKPVASFRISYPQTIRPARALFDGSLSFHPDFRAGTPLSYSWEVDGLLLKKKGDAVSGPYVYEQATAGSDAKVFFEFKTVGEHQVGLTVTKTPNGSRSDKVLDKTTVKTLLGVDFTVSPNFAARVGDVLTFTASSDNALGFYWDFGDGATQVGLPGSTPQPPPGQFVPQVIDPKSGTVAHKYEQQGTYPVKLTVEDGAGNTNTITKKVRVGLQNQPVAFVQVFVNSLEKDLEEGECIEITRNDNILFDAGQSLNVAGQTNGLSYLWRIEDFEEIIQTRTFGRIFKDLTQGGCFDIDLSVTDLSINATNSADTLSVKVVNSNPEITDLRFIVTEQDLVTPVTVNVSAVGTRDLDGRVARYRWWYYEDGQQRKKLDQRVTDSGRTTFVIGPTNTEGTETTYFFAVEAEDNDGGVFNTVDRLGDSKPLVVTNGPNVAPVAEFVTDRSTVNTGELIEFHSTTRDPLGEFIPSAAYQWDFEGDGEYERGITGPDVTHRYDKPGLYQANLKVTKNGLSSEYEMLVRVLPSTKKPEAAFIYIPSGVRVKFVSNAQVDSSLEDKTIRYEWDFDTNKDSNGNGIPDDDADSALISPVFEFAGDRDVFVSHRVIDSVGNSDRVTRIIPFLKTDQSKGALGASKNVRLRPVLITNPVRNQIDGKIYVRPPVSDVVFNAKPSLGNIQEYRIDSNIFTDSDGDGIADNDIDNKTHKSWKDGTSFKWTYRETEQPIRAKLTLVDLEGRQKSEVIDVVFSEKDPQASLDQAASPEEILSLFENVPVVSFTVNLPFTAPGETITFDASRTKFPNEKVKEYRWDFDGDGLVDEISFEPTFTYAYPKAGEYEAILEAVSEKGLQGEYSQTIYVRGGLALPEAKFEYEVKDNQINLTNLSTVDPSFREEEMQYEWTFTALDLSTVAEWASWEKADEYIVSEPEFDQPPLWAQESIVIEESSIAPGVLSREVVLGSQEFVARFKEGTTFVKVNEPYLGKLQFLSESGSVLQIPEKETIGVYETGVSEILELSDQVQLVYQGVILDPELYQLQESAEPSLLGTGVVEENQTVFTLNTFGGRYLLTGTIEESEAGGVVLGVSTVKNPVKVLPEEGVYRVTLQVMDPQGQKNEMSELITIDGNLTFVEPGTIPSDNSETPSEEPEVTPPEIVPDANGGLSYWWLAIIIVIVGVVGAVAFVVVRTIRRHQEELESEPVPAAPIKPVEVIKPEVVERKKEEKPVSVPVPPKPAAAAPASKPVTPPPAPTPKPAPKPPEEKKPPTDSKGGGGGGAIPDWLKG